MEVVLLGVLVTIAIVDITGLVYNKVRLENIEKRLDAVERGEFKDIGKQEDKDGE